MKTVFCRGRRMEIPPGFPLLMGILNATPDSFSDGIIPVREKTDSLLAEKPDIIDIGGESTRPGSAEIPESEEIDRVLPVLEAVRTAAPEIFISVDTRKSAVAEACLKAGADLVNDVSSLHFDSRLAFTAAEFSAGLILNHSRGTPANMNNPEFLDYPGGLAETVRDELASAVEKALAAGVRGDSLILDPGFGFAKTPAQSEKLIRDPSVIQALGFPLLSGPSRKGFIGGLTGEKSPLRRDYGTCGAVIASYLSGYDVIRVHNVKAARDALKVFIGIRNS